MLQALLAAVAAGQGEGEDDGPAAEGDAAAAEQTEEWHSMCAQLVNALGSTVRNVVAVSGDSASALLLLEQLGVWRLLEQLVEATGAPCCAWML